jgi:beta-glucosidase-like glycosyl hydrolase
MFAPLDSSSVFKIGIDQMGSKPHMDLALEAARQSTVLLRNHNGTLPLGEPKKGTKIVVIGPQANATGMLGGNYFNSECASGTVIWNTSAGGGGQLSWWPCVPTLFDAVKTRRGERRDGNIRTRVQAALLWDGDGRGEYLHENLRVRS